MGLLKLKLKASTLVETLVGTVIIVVIFAIASMTLNSVFKNTMKNNTLQIDNHLYKLQYLHQNNKLIVPYQEEFGNWEIEINKKQKDTPNQIEIQATNKLTNKIRNVSYAY